MKLSAIVLLSMAVPVVYAHTVAQTTEAVLAASQKAMGPVPTQGAIRVTYDLLDDRFRQRA